jgi:hypothetical protein
LQTRLLTLLLLLNGCFYVTANEHAGRWDIDGDGVERPKDCNDRDKDVQDLSWYEDLDGDGFGDPDTAVSNCDAPPGTVDNGDDCDDSSPRLFVSKSVCSNFPYWNYDAGS